MKGKKGFSVIEVLGSLAIISIVSVGFLNSLINAYGGSGQIDRMDTARALAQSQMEYVKEQAFNLSGSYLTNDAIMSEYPGYSVQISAIPAVDRDVLIQKISVTILNNGKTITTLENCRVK
jgi:prepilin-type N-terminal cleavage/methylation domain-containing protein